MSEAAPRRSKLVIILSALVVVNLAGTGAIAMKVLGTPEPPPDPTRVVEHKEEPAGPTVTLDPILINLDEPDGRQYLNAVFDVELASTDAVAPSSRRRSSPCATRCSPISPACTSRRRAARRPREKIRTFVRDRIATVLGADRVRRVFVRNFVVQ